MQAEQHQAKLPPPPSHPLQVPPDRGRRTGGQDRQPWVSSTAAPGSGGSQGM